MNDVTADCPDCKRPNDACECEPLGPEAWGAMAAVVGKDRIRTPEWVVPFVSVPKTSEPLHEECLAVQDPWLFTIPWLPSDVTRFNNLHAAQVATQQPQSAAGPAMQFGVANQIPTSVVSVDRKAESLIPVGQGWSDPPAEVLTDPGFEAIWDVIKTWDINVPSAYGGYCGATGNHVYAIYRAMAAVAPQHYTQIQMSYAQVQIDACLRRAESAERMLQQRGISPFTGLPFSHPLVGVLPEDHISELTAKNQLWQETWSATEWQRQQAVALVEERDREIVQLRAERAAWKYLFEAANPDARMVAADEGSNREYHGPVKDGKAIPDPVHERVHEVIGDVLGGNVMRPARDQLEKALSDARVKDGKAPPFPSVTKPTDHRRLSF